MRFWRQWWWKDSAREWGILSLGSSCWRIYLHGWIPFQTLVYVWKCVCVRVERDRQRGKGRRAGEGAPWKQLQQDKMEFVSTLPELCTYPSVSLTKLIPILCLLDHFEELLSTSILNIEHILHVACICREYRLGFMPLLAIDNRMDDLCSSIWLVCKNPNVARCFCVSFNSLWPQVKLDQRRFPAAGHDTSISSQHTISNTKLAKLDSQFSPNIQKVFFFFLSLILQCSHASLTFFWNRQPD